MVNKVIIILNTIRRFGDHSLNLDFGYFCICFSNEKVKINFTESDFSSNVVIEFKEVFKDDVINYVINLKKIDNKLLMRFSKVNFRGDFITENTDDLDLLNEVINHLDVQFSKIEIPEKINERIIFHFKKSLSALDKLLVNTDKSMLFFTKSSFRMMDFYKNPIKLDWIDPDFIGNYGYNNSFRFIDFLSSTQIFQEYENNFNQMSKDYELVLFTTDGEFYCGSKMNKELYCTVK